MPKRKRPILIKRSGIIEPPGTECKNIYYKISFYVRNIEDDSLNTWIYLPFHDYKDENNRHYTVHMGCLTVFHTREDETLEDLLEGQLSYHMKVVDDMYRKIKCYATDIKVEEVKEIDYNGILLNNIIYRHDFLESLFS